MNRSPLSGYILCGWFRPVIFYLVSLLTQETALAFQLLMRTEKKNI